MALSAGSAFFDLLPSARGVSKNITRELSAPAGKAGALAGSTFNTAANTELRKRAPRTGMAAGAAMSTGMGGSLKRGMGRFGGVVKGGMGRVAGAVKGAISPIGGMIAGAFAVTAVASFFKSAIDGASDLSESLSKTQVVFGKYADSVIRASNTSAKAMGLSKQAYLESTATFGNLLVSLDLGPKKAAAMSQQMVKLAGDLASFNNTSPEEALDALRAGLVGETEPLKRFGVNMNETTLRAQAMKMGIVDNVKTALNPQQKALAAQALIMAQTKTAQGDFARTSGGLANQQRILAAQVKNAKDALGTAMLPVMQTFVRFLTSSVLPKLQVFINLMRQHPVALKLVAAGLGGLALGLLGVAVAFGVMTLAASPWIAIALGIGVAIGLLAAGFVMLWKRSQTFRTIVTAVWNGIKAAVAVAWTVIKAIFAGIKWYVTKVLAPVFKWIWRNIVVPAFRGIQLAVRIAWAAIRIIFAAIVFVLRKTLGPVFKWLWRNVIQPAWVGIKLTISAGWRFIRPILTALGDFIRSKVAPAFRKGVDAIKAAWERVKQAAKAPVNFIIGTVYGKGIKGLFDKVAKAVGSKVRMPHIPMLASGTESLTKASQAGWRNRPTAIVGEGSRRYAESVIPTDPKYRSRAVGLWRETGRRLGMPMMAGGGFLGGIFGKIKDFVTDPLGSFKKLAAKPLDLMKKFAGSTFGRLMSAIPRKLIDLITSRVGALFGGGGNTASIIAMAKRMDGGTYTWGGASLRHNDCSGSQSILHNVGTSDKPYFRRMFTTASFSGGRNVGAFKRSLANTSPYRVSVNPGSHMWGRVKDGSGRWHGVESGGPYSGFRYTSSVRGGGQYHYGLAFKKLATGGKLDKRYFPFPLEGMPSRMLARVVKREGAQVGVFDNGGTLNPGEIGVNLSRRPEVVRTERQYAAELAGAAAQRGLMRDVYITEQGSPYAVMDELQWVLRKMGRGGRYATA